MPDDRQELGHERIVRLAPPAWLASLKHIKALINPDKQVDCLIVHLNPPELAEFALMLGSRSDVALPTNVPSGRPEDLSVADPTLVALVLLHLDYAAIAGM